MPAPIVPIGVALARLIAKHGLPAVQKAMKSPAKVPQKKVVSISTKKPLTSTQMKTRNAKARVDRVKKSEAAEDLKNKNLDNFNRKFDRKPKTAAKKKTTVTRKNNSQFGPVAAGIVKPKPKGKGPRGR
jgi:L-lactate utilization protein LutC